MVVGEGRRRGRAARVDPHRHPHLVQRHRHAGRGQVEPEHLVGGDEMAEPVGGRVQQGVAQCEELGRRQLGRGHVRDGLLDHRLALVQIEEPGRLGRVVHGGHDDAPEEGAGLLDHIEAKNCVLNQVEYVVLDEADRMLDMGFQPQVDRILRTGAATGERPTTSSSRSGKRRRTHSAQSRSCSLTMIDSRVMPAATIVAFLLSREADYITRQVIEYGGLFPFNVARLQKKVFLPAITTKDGVELFYKDLGKGQPIVFSHGWPLSADDWDNQMLFFLGKGYRVIAHDRRGHGRRACRFKPVTTRAAKACSRKQSSAALRTVPR